MWEVESTTVRFSAVWGDVCQCNKSVRLTVLPVNCCECGWLSPCIQNTRNQTVTTVFWSQSKINIECKLDWQLIITDSQHHPLIRGETITSGLTWIEAEGAMATGACFSQKFWVQILIPTNDDDEFKWDQSSGASRREDLGSVGENYAIKGNRLASNSEVNMDTRIGCGETWGTWLLVARIRQERKLFRSDRQCGKKCLIVDGVRENKFRQTCMRRIHRRYFYQNIYIDAIERMVNTVAKMSTI